MTNTTIPADTWICQACLRLIPEKELATHGTEGAGHDVGDEEPHYCGPCVPLDYDDLQELLEELAHERWKQRQAARVAARTHMKADPNTVPETSLQQKGASEAPVNPAVQQSKP